MIDKGVASSKLAPTEHFCGVLTASPGNQSGGWPWSARTSVQNGCWFDLVVSGAMKKTKRSIRLLNNRPPQSQIQNRSTIMLDPTSLQSPLQAAVFHALDIAFNGGAKTYQMAAQK